MSDLEVESPMASQRGRPELRRNSKEPLSRLLVDYTGKLDQIRKQYKDIAAQLKSDRNNSLCLNERDSIFAYYDKMQSHLERLARVASAQLAHGRLDSVSQIEIELRLAEFEASLAATDSLIKAKL